MRALQVFWNYMKINASNEFQYRANFFIQLIQSAISLATGLIGLALVFQFTATLGGWSKAELLAIMGVYILMGGVINAYIQPNMNRMLQEVHQGTLDFALTKPVDGQVLVSVRELNFWQLTDVLVGLAVIGVASSSLSNRIGIEAVIAFLCALFLGATMIYCFWLILSCVAFWVVKFDDFVQLFQGLYAAGRWPIGIYPNWLRMILTFLVPVAFAVTIPTEALTNRLTPLTLLGEAALTILFFGLARFTWKIGLRKYSGASA